MSTEPCFARDTRGDWRPEGALAPKPLFVWPPRPLATLKWLIGYPGYFFPWAALYLGIAALTWEYLTPSLARMQTLEPRWIAHIFLRNLGVLLLVVSAWHLRLYVRKAQGTDYKYSGRWLSKNNQTFLFADQVRDNIFWTLVSAVPIWTAYEVLTLWAFASGHLHAVDWRAYPIYCAILIFATPFWQELHFYLVHRLIHWRPIYRRVHYLHHKNMNPGPWSGLAMHPVEHLLYFSGVLVCWILPATPFQAMFLLQITALVPAQGHAAFDRLVITKRISIPASDYFHYLHHKFVECNYGAERVPLDRWFGTFHDGTKESESTLRARLRSRRPVVK